MQRRPERTSTCRRSHCTRLPSRRLRVLFIKMANSKSTMTLADPDAPRATGSRVAGAGPATAAEARPLVLRHVMNLPWDLAVFGRPPRDNVDGAEPDGLL